MLWSLANNRIPRAPNLFEAINIYWSFLIFSTTQTSSTIMEFCIITANVSVSILTKFGGKLFARFWGMKDLVRLTRIRHLKANLTCSSRLGFYTISKVDWVHTVLFQTREKGKLNGHWILSKCALNFFFSNMKTIV